MEDRPLVEREGGDAFMRNVAWAAEDPVYCSVSACWGCRDQRPTIMAHGTMYHEYPPAPTHACTHALARSLARSKGKKAATAL